MDINLSHAIKSLNFWDDFKILFKLIYPYCYFAS